MHSPPQKKKKVSVLRPYMAINYINDYKGKYSSSVRFLNLVAVIYWTLSYNSVHIFVLKAWLFKK